jgi:GNAT superfamily N-acetyltransferase
MKKTAKKPSVKNVKVVIRAVGYKHMYRDVIALKGDKKIGKFRIFMPNGSTELHAHGTMVEDEYQGLGVGTRLWERAIEKYKPTFVSVSTISEGGERMVRKLMSRHKQIDWDHW